VLITLTTTMRPATDLGFLLFKHPDKAQAFTTSSGTAHVFYPRADEQKCTAALLLDVDPIGLVRGRKNDAFTLGQYVNDRPYAAGSLLAVALSTVFKTAMNGRCDQRPELVEQAIPLSVRVPAAPCSGGPELVERLFAPLGWTVDARAIPLDPEFPDWGDSRYVDLRLDGELRLADALRHLYVLLPVMDGAKHYWVAEDEIEKLLRAGDGWLPTHPERELISLRYLAHRKSLARTAMAQLAELDGTEAETVDNALAEPTVTLAEPLSAVRRRAVIDALHQVRAHRVLDLGCGGGALLRELLADPTFTEIVGCDVSAAALDAAERRLNLDRLSDRVRDRVELRQSSVTYTDPALAGYDAAVLMEVVEHVDPSRLPALEHAVFGAATPRHVVVTTPNVEYNVLYPNLPEGKFRHPDHRFEWTRAQFHDWADGVAARRGYTVRYVPVGPHDETHGSPTQLALFSRKEA